MRLILVRHGQTSSNTGALLDTAVPGADLTATGREQAAGLVERMAAERIEAIYASTLVRTQQTAGPLAADRGLPIQVLPGLREVSAGDYEMATDAREYIAVLIGWAEGRLEAKLPGGEDAMEFFARFDDAIATISAADHEVALLVSHGAALRVWAVARVSGFVDAVGNGYFDNTDLIVIEGDPVQGWTLVSLDGFIEYNDELGALNPEDAEEEAVS